MQFDIQEQDCLRLPVAKMLSVVQPLANPNRACTFDLPIG